MGLRIIVNADDLGASPEINARIFELMRVGAVTSATVLANAPYCEQALAEVQAFPGCSFGVHLNATEFSPLVPAAEFSPMLDGQGAFRNVIRQTRLGPALRRALYREWSAQVEKVRTTGVAISHLDSHNHVHTIPALLPVLRQVARTHGIRQVRISMNLFGREERKPQGLLWKKTAFNCALRLCQFRITAHFASFENFCSWEGRWPCPLDTIELMTHPGHPKYAAETTLLESNWRKELPAGARLISYHEL